MENSNIILIEEQEKEDARALTQSFARSDVKSRAYINALGARVCMKYFEEENISSEPAYNLHNIRKILEEFDISDIMLSNIHVDVRVIFDENQIFIPKSHFEYNILPDIYVVLKLDKEHKNTEFLGFFEPKLINKNNANSDYYFIEKEKLSSPVDLKNFIQNFEGSTSKEYSEEDMNNAEVLMISMTDNNVTDEEKRILLDYLVHSAELRDEFIEYENFEMLSYHAASTVGFEIPVKTEDMDVAEIPSEELPEDITDSMITEEASAVDETEQTLPGETAAVIGAEIAGAAMASAALTGVEEVADSAANIINAAANVANITSEAIDMASSIQNMAEQVFSDENLTEPEVSNFTGIQEEEVVQPLTPAEEETQEIEDSIAAPEDLIEETETESENANGSLDDLFGGLDNSNDDIFNNSSDELEFTNSSSDDLVFENYDDSNEITFSNNDDYGDYVEYGDSSDSYGDASSSSAARQQSLPQAHGVHTPISEATELMSLEDIQNGNLPPQNSAPAAEPAGSQMETMEMDEFHSLVESYVPTEIKNESETVGFESIGQAETLPQTETKEIEPAVEQKASIPCESDAFVEDMPEEVENNSNWGDNAEPTSDDFVEEMPDEIEDLAANLKLDEELTSDDFIEDMPEAIDNSVNWGDSNEPTSDDFVEQMPDEIENLAANIKLDEELTSDDFIEDMPEEVKTETEVKEELTSDDFVEDLETLETPEEHEEEKPAPEIAEISEEINAEEPQETFDEMSIIDELDNLDSLGLGEIESVSEEPAIQNDLPQDEPEIEINEEEPAEITSEIEDESPALGVLYNDNHSTELNDIELEQPAAENYDFRPEKKNNKIMTLFAVVAAIVIAGAFVSFLVKSKNSIDAETLIQAAPENEVLATPEADNSDILANTGEAIPEIPQDASNAPAPAAPAANTPEQAKKAPSVQQAEKNSIAAAAAPKPLNGSKTVTVKKISWQVPDYLSYSENIKKYLQTAGKSIKLTLSSDLLLTNEYIYSNQVKVDLKLSKDGNVQSSKIIKSSGSEEIDKIVLRTVNETLNVVKPAQGEVPTPNYNLAIIIYL